MPGQTRHLASFAADTALADVPDHVRTRLMQCLLDFDDVHIASGRHPGAAVIPAAPAIAERAEVSGSELLSALAVGYEVCCRVGAALGRGAYHRGFHPTAVAGLFGGAAAAGRLLRLDSGRIAGAFGLAGSMAAGSIQYLANGAENKRLHAGLAAHNAVLAATFAVGGVRGAADAIEGNLGLLHGYSQEPQADLLTAGLGTAVALLDGRVDWASYQRIADPDVRGLAAAIELVTDDSLPEAGAVLTVAYGSREATGTAETTVRIHLPSGEPGTSLSWRLVRAKYDGLTGHRLPGRVADAIADLASVISVRDLLRILRTPLIQENS